MIALASITGAAAAGENYYRTSSKYGDSGGGGSGNSNIQADGGSLEKTIAPKMHFTNKNGSQHVPLYSLGNHGLVDSNPYLTNNYNRSAEQRNMKSLQKSLSVDMEKTRKPHVETLIFLVLVEV